MSDCMHICSVLGVVIISTLMMLYLLDNEENL